MEKTSKSSFTSEKWLQSSSACIDIRLLDAQTAVNNSNTTETLNEMKKKNIIHSESKWFSTQSVRKLFYFLLNKTIQKAHLSWQREMQLSRLLAGHITVFVE